jgi:hypothetical protein
MFRNCSALQRNDLCVAYRTSPTLKTIPFAKSIFAIILKSKIVTHDALSNELHRMFVNYYSFLISFSTRDV